MEIYSSKPQPVNSGHLKKHTIPLKYLSKRSKMNYEKKNRHKRNSPKLIRHKNEIKVLKNLSLIGKIIITKADKGDAVLNYRCWKMLRIISVKSIDD